MRREEKGIKTHCVNERVVGANFYFVQVIPILQSPVGNICEVARVGHRIHFIILNNVPLNAF